MSEYINREDLMDARQKAIWVYENANILNATAIRDNLKYLLDQIVDLPTVDVKHGYWTEEKHSHWSESWGRVGSYSYTYQCSECGNHFRLPHNYCPDCGSKNKLKTQGGYNLGW